MRMDRRGFIMSWICGMIAAVIPGVIGLMHPARNAYTVTIPVMNGYIPLWRPPRDGPDDIVMTDFHVSDVTGFEDAVMRAMDMFHDRYGHCGKWDEIRCEANMRDTAAMGKEYAFRVERMSDGREEYVDVRTFHRLGRISHTTDTAEYGRMAYESGMSG